MGYTLKQVDIKDSVRVYIKADSNDADYISTLRDYSLDLLEDDGFLICVKAMRDLKESGQRHNLTKCFRIWDELYGEDVREYLEFALTEYLDIPRNDYDYDFCHTLYVFNVEIYKDGRLYDLVLDQMPNIPQ